LLLDFAGNSGRHRLVSALDILAGKYTDDEVKAAKDIAEKAPGIDAQEALEKAKGELAEKARKEAEREAARRATVKAKKVAYTARTVNPFRLFGVQDPEATRGDWQAPPADPAQIEQLKRWGFDVPPDCTSSQAETLIRKAKHRRAAGLCTYKQARTLAKQGFDTSKMRFETASSLIQALFDHNWRPPQDLVRSILSGERQPGMEG
jgi:hypothetical protein